MDTLACHLLRAPQLGGDVCIGALLNEACQQRAADRLRKRGELLVELAPADPRALLYPFKVTVIKCDPRHPQPLARPGLHAPAAQALAQLVARDPVQPRHSRAAAFVGVRAAHHRSERLRGEIKRQLSVWDTAAKERNNAVEMLAVEVRKRLLIPTSNPAQQLLIA